MLLQKVAMVVKVMRVLSRAQFKHHLPVFEGEIRFIRLELKSLSDVGFIGFLNCQENQLF